ncbi:MAG: histidine kinase [Prevotella sp.]|nr:histidine kinase [Prevotella sp.]MBR1933715.1 histidine kinase [Prevotella sp.]
MKFLRSQSKQETLVYLVLWGALFAAPVVSIYIHHAETSSPFFPWHELLAVWRQMAVLLVLFLLHNYLLAPLIVYRQRRLPYFSAIAVLVGCFFVAQCIDSPDRQPHDRPHHEFAEHEPPPPMPVGQHDIVATLILVLMLGMNLGVKLYFKQRKDEQRLALLEKENLEQQLQYLRYQINPHFLMNTLNNIHALVDIDAEQAKATIVELSKIMRFALYEGSKQRVPLSRDIAFLQSYIQLMRLRYTDRVAITVCIPADLPPCEIPPMMFITFVENAFKHGISYQQPSFIDISLKAQGRQLVFACRNSKAPQSAPSRQEGGVGLQNVQRRLQLIYATRYALHIDDAADTYHVRLAIPLNN